MSRTGLLRVRILSGLAQAMALAVVPWGVMFVVAVTTGKANSVSQAFFHVILLAGGGVVFFAIALLVSSLVEGEYTAPAPSFGIMFTDVVALGEGPLRAISPWNFIVGGEYFDRASAQLVGPLPLGAFCRQRFDGDSVDCRFDKSHSANRILKTQRRPLMLRITAIVAALAVPSVASQVSTDARPSFSVASIKPTAPDARLGVAIHPGGGRNLLPAALN